MLHLATCHECVKEDIKEDDKNVKLSSTYEINFKNVRYSGPSPDEVTLVDFSRHYSFVYIEQNSY